MPKWLGLDMPERESKQRAIASYLGVQTVETGECAPTGGQRRIPAGNDLAIGESGTTRGGKWRAWQESNPQPLGPKPSALSIELQTRDEPGPLL